jgi:hypothetical protein
MENRYLIFFDISSGRRLRTTIPAREVRLVGGQLRDNDGQVIANKSGDGHPWVLNRWVLNRLDSPDLVGDAFDDYRFE